MKTQLQLSAAAVRANPRVRPANNNVPPIAVRAPLAGAPLTTGKGQALPLQFARWIFLQFCIFAFLPIFSQTSAPDFTDPRDGEKYKTVIMPDGKRWMAENLRYRKGLNNPIFSNNTTANSFAASKSTYYCPGPGPLNTSVNQADPLSCEYWGALYPFWVAYANSANTAVNTTLGEQGICPNGWHLPTDNEWNLLFTKIGGATDAGKLLKDTARGTFANNQAYKRYWTNAALQNTNSYGFSALAAGLRTTAGAYFGNGTQALFWTSTPNTNGTQASSKIFTNSSNSSTGSSTQNRADALSVRCVEGGCDEGFRVPFLVSKNGSKTLDQAFDTVFFVRSSVFYYTVFALPTATGTWSYTVTPVSSSLPSGVTVDVQSFSQPRIMGTDILIELLFKGLSSANDGQTVRFSIVASNPNYCNINQDLFITFKEYFGTTMTDNRDGKVYKTVIMPDGKEWMAENLNYQTGMTFRATSNSPNGTTGGGQGSLSFWCPGIDDKGTSDVRTLADCEKYGALYTWDAAMWRDGSSANGGLPGTITCIYGNYPCTNNNQVGGRGICPSGWHVPTDNEWGLMLNAVETTNGNSLSAAINSGTTGGYQNHNIGSSPSQYCLGIDAGMRLTHSSGVNYGLPRTDQYGFSVLPAGFRRHDGANFLLREVGTYFWSASSYDASHGWNRSFHVGLASVVRNPDSRSHGFSVRCLRD